MKEDLRQVWGWTGDKQAAEYHVKSWREVAKNSGTDMLLKIPRTLERHLEGIVAYLRIGDRDFIVEQRRDGFETILRQDHGNRVLFYRNR